MCSSIIKEQMKITITDLQGNFISDGIITKVIPESYITFENFGFDKLTIPYSELLVKDSQGNDLFKAEFLGVEGRNNDDNIICYRISYPTPNNIFDRRTFVKRHSENILVKVMLRGVEESVILKDISLGGVSFISIFNIPQDDTELIFDIKDSDKLTLKVNIIRRKFIEEDGYILYEYSGEFSNDTKFADRNIIVDSISSL